MKFDKICDLVILPEAYITGEHAMILSPNAFEQFQQYNQSTDALNKTGRYPKNSKTVNAPVPEELVEELFQQLEDMGFPQSEEEANVGNAHQFSRSTVVEIAARLLKNHWDSGDAKAAYVAKNLFPSLVKSGAMQKKSFKGERAKQIDDIDQQPKKQRGRPAKQKTLKVLQKNVVNSRQKAFFTDKILSFLSDGSASLKELQTAVVKGSIVDNMYEGNSVKAADDFQTVLNELVASGDVTKVISRGAAPMYKLGAGSSISSDDAYSPDKLDSALGDADWMGSGSGEEEFSDEDLEPKENPRIALMKRLMRKHKNG